MDIKLTNIRLTSISKKIHKSENMKEKYYKDYDKVIFIQAKSINELSKLTKSLNKGVK